MNQLKEPIYFSSATAIAKAIRNKEISSEEITKVFLDRISYVNPKINAVIQLATEKVLNSARKADEIIAKGGKLGHFHGVPMTIKDSFDTEGVISSAGTLGRSKYIPEKNASVVNRLKNAGAILLGKTNTPELTMAGYTDNLVYGQTNNPYNLNNSPGGSSGGAAAIVGAGGSAFDIGTDSGGSIRVPSSFCGVCGISPTAGRVARTGHIISFQGYDQSLTTVGPIARHVDDLIQILPIISGNDGIDPYVYDIPLGNPDNVDISKLKFAFYTNNGIAKPTVEIVQTITEISNELANIGIRIDEKRPDIIEQSVELFLEILWADKGYSLNKILAEVGTKKVSPYLGLASDIKEFDEDCISPKQFAELFERWAMFKSEMGSFFTDYDIILCPVSATPAHYHGLKDIGVYSYTMTHNLTGWPAAVVPTGTSPEGLPLGVQIVGKPWQEHKVLAVAKYVEEKFGGFQPPII